jgi:hypothetical protein
MAKVKNPPPIFLVRSHPGYTAMKAVFLTFCSNSKGKEESETVSMSEHTLKVA